MDNFEVEVHGVKVKVSVVDDPTLIDQTISELRSLQQQRSLMGLDIKSGWGLKPKLLLLCAGSRCLIIPKFYHFFNPDYPFESRIPDQLAHLLGDRNICFVGIGIENKNRKFPELRKMQAAVELGHLAARILKKPNLKKSGLLELGGAVGVDIKPQSGVPPPSWGARIFSEQEIKYAIHDVYSSYLIGDKLLGML